MPRFKALEKTEVAPQARALLDGVEKKLGTVPNLMRTMANAPAVLDAYLGFGAALGKSSLPTKLREQIALAVGQANSCGYCLAAHAALGRMAGLSAEEIADSRRASSPDRKTEAALAFAGKLVAERGWVSDADVAQLRDTGFSDGEAIEIVAVVAINIFTNYLNHVAGTEVDFPEVPEMGAGQPHTCNASCGC